VVGPQAIRVLEACFDVVLVETVGVGQSEIDITRLADTTIVVLAPGFGDSIQFAKAGVLEIADLFVVNKADRDGAEAVMRDLKAMVALGRPRGLEQPWNPPVVATVAHRHVGADALYQAVTAHWEYIRSQNVLDAKRMQRAAYAVEAIALHYLQSRIATLQNGQLLETVARQVADREIDPYVAAQQLFDELRR
jgi:LAO/AO transport system kinase